MSYIIYFIYFITCLSILLYIFNKTYNLKKREIIFRRFSELYVLYDLAKENSYDQLFLSTISPNIASGYKIKNDEVPELQKEFIKKVKNILGISVWEDIEYIKGDITSIRDDLAFYLITRLVQDEKIYSTVDMEDDMTDDYLENVNNNFFSTSSMIKNDIENQ